MPDQIPIAAAELEYTSLNIAHPGVIPKTFQGSLRVHDRGDRVGPVSTPIVIDVAGGNNRTVRNGSIGCGVVGGFFVVAGLIAALGSNLGAGVVILVIGLITVGVGLYPLLNRKAFRRPRRFVIDQDLIRWQDPRDLSWALRWDELREITISKPGPDQPRSTYGVSRSRPAGVRVDLVPRSDVVHPEMAHLWELDEVKGAWSVPLGQNQDLVPHLEDAFRTFDRTGVFRGVVEG